MVIDLLGRLVPRDEASFLENLGCRSGFFACSEQLILWDGSHRAIDTRLYGVEHHVGAQQHQAVMHRLYIVGAGDWHPALLDDVARVNLVLQEESGHTRLSITVHHRPVDGRGTTILGQQRSVQVEGAQRRHGPHHLRQHSEGYHDVQVGPDGAQLVHKLLVLEVHGLQQGQTLCHGILLHG